MALPRSFDEKRRNTMAVDTLNIIEAPNPCASLKMMS
jgi:hypothetical protein